MPPQIQRHWAATMAVEVIDRELTRAVEEANQGHIQVLKDMTPHQLRTVLQSYQQLLTLMSREPSLMTRRAIQDLLRVPLQNRLLLNFRSHLASWYLACNFNRPVEDFQYVRDKLDALLLGLVTA